MRKLLILAALVCPLAHATPIACITTPGTYDATLGASWVGGTAPNIAGGDTITCATSGVKEIFTTNYIIGTSPAAGTKVINFTGGSTVGPGHNAILTVLGDLAASNVSEAAGSEILFDSTGAGSPTSTPYTLTTNSFVQDASFPTANTVGNIFSITANPSGTNWRWAVATAGSGITGLTNFNFSLCGDPGGAAQCLPYNPGGSGSVAIGPGIFDTTCGIKLNSGMTVNDAYAISGITFKNTYSSCVNMNWTYGSGAYPAGGVARTITNTVFDAAPTLQTPRGTVTGAIFFQCWNPSFNPADNGIMTYSWIKNPTEGGCGGYPQWDFTNVFITSDDLLTYSGGLVHAPTPGGSGTASSTTTTSLTDTTKNYPTSMVNDGVTNGWTIYVTSGPAINEARAIRSITGSGTIVNITIPWNVSPGANPTYAIYNEMANPHFTNVSGGTTLAVTFTGTLGWYPGGDWNGDFFHGMGQTNVLYSMINTLLLPNPARSNSGTLSTLAVSGASPPNYIYKGNVYFVGEQGNSMCEGCTSSAVGTVQQMFDNLAWQDPAVNYNNGLGFLTDVSSGGAVSGYPADIIKTNCGISGIASCGDFNGSYGIPGSNGAIGAGYCSTIHSGSALYNLNCTVPYGLNDVTNKDPGFLNRWASPLTYTQSLGVDTSQGDDIIIFADLWNQMMSVNDPTPSSHVSGFSPAAMWNYHQTAFTRTNALFHGTGGTTTGADGSDIGGTPYMAPTATPNFSTSGAVKFSGPVVIQ